MTEDRLKLLIQERADAVNLSKYPIYCDIDNTLIIWNLSYTKYEPNHQVIEALKYMHSTGLIEVVLWSAAGAGHCREVAEEFGLTNIVSAYLTKPVAVIDDVKVVAEFMTYIHPENI